MTEYPHEFCGNSGRRSYDIIFDWLNLNDKSSTIVDFGCGDASYIKKINNCCESLEKVAAFDGNPNVEYISGGFANCQDLTIPFNIDYKFDLYQNNMN